MSETCENCKWWDRNGFTSSRVAMCRRNPPTPTRDRMAGATTQWPASRADDWCGEYRARAAIEGEKQ